MKGNVPFVLLLSLIENVAGDNPGEGSFVLRSSLEIGRLEHHSKLTSSLVPAGHMVFHPIRLKFTCDAPIIFHSLDT